MIAPLRLHPQSRNEVATTYTFVPMFDRALVRTGSRLMICSTCLKCGESKVVSSADGSLDGWEEGHQCRPAISVPPRRDDQH